jgi:DNA-dependent RNA polymerase auxiliary subunit epsilon
MRYRAYFLGTTDEMIMRAPGPINVNVKKNFINLEFIKKIPMEHIQNVSIEYESSNKAFSVAKAGAGLLLAGPVGLIGGALGGKKVATILTIKYLNENTNVVEVKLEGNATALIKKKYDKHKFNVANGLTNESSNTIRNVLYWGSTVGIWVAIFKLYFRFYKWLFQCFKAMKK